MRWEQTKVYECRRVFCRYGNVRTAVKFVNTLALFVFVSVLPCTPFAAEKRTTLEEVDQVVQKAESVQGLLEDSRLGEAHRNAYFEALRGYFDHPNFTRERYDAILNQLRTVAKAVPELAPRLWETTGTGTSFDLKVPINDNGRTVGEKWDSYYLDYVETLNRQGASALQKHPDATVTLDENRVKSMLRTLKAAEEIHRKSRSVLKSKKDKAALDSVFFQKMRQDPDVKALSAAIARTYFEKEEVRDWLATKNADIILETLKDLYNNPLLGVSPELQAELPPGMNTALKDVFIDPEAVLHESSYKKLLQDMRTKINISNPLPDGLPPEELAKIRETRNRILSKAVEEFNAKDGALFPVPIDYSRMNRAQIVPSRAHGSVVTFRAIPRRIHGIWKGIPLGECVGGRYCDDSWLTPRRWATSALAGTQTHFVEVEDAYNGFTQQTAATINKKNYGSLEIGSRVLGNRVVLKEGGTKQAKTLFELWLPEANRRRPPEWKSLVLGKSNDIDNAGVLAAVRTTDSYNLKPPMMQAEVQLVDQALAQKIEAVGINTRYGKRMIVDALQNVGGEIHSLSPATFDLKSKEQLLKLMKSAEFERNSGFAEMVLRKIPKNWFEDEKILAAVLSHLGSVGHWSQFEKLAKTLPQTEVRFKLFAAAYERANKSDGTVSRIFESLLGRTESSGNPWDGMSFTHHPSFKTENLDAKTALLKFVDKFYRAPGLSDSNLEFLESVSNELSNTAEGREAFKRILDVPEGPGRSVLLKYRILSPDYQDEILKRLSDPEFLGRSSIIRAMDTSPSMFGLAKSPFWQKARDLMKQNCAGYFGRIKGASSGE